ncbi:MAG: hypothetical protein ACP5MU_06860 [Thermoplasmata archaeon]
MDYDLYQKLKTKSNETGVKMFYLVNMALYSYLYDTESGRVYGN